MYKCAIEKSRRSLVKMETFVKYLFYTASLLNMSEQCTNAKYPYENHLATKTPYRIVANGTFGEVQYEGKIFLVSLQLYIDTMYLINLLYY